MLVGGTVTESGVARGYVLARVVHGDQALPRFEHWFPASGPSGVFGVLASDYDWLFVAGVATANGETQARITRIHG